MLQYGFNTSMWIGDIKFSLQVNEGLLGTKELLKKKKKIYYLFWLITNVLLDFSYDEFHMLARAPQITRCTSGSFLTTTKATPLTHLEKNPNH